MGRRPPPMKSPLWIEQEAARAYEAGERTGDIATRLGIHKDTVVNIARRAGLTIRRSGTVRGAINEHFFGEIDTEESAYWAGFIAADGNVMDDGVFSVGLSAADVGHLEKLRAALKATNPVRVYAARAPSVTPSGQLLTPGPVAVFASKSPTLCAGLARHGITPRKSLTAVAPDLRTDLMRHYWRGAFDGDGGIWKGSTRNPRAWGASFTGSDAMASQFCGFVRAHLGTVGCMQPHSVSAGVSTFSAGGAFGVYRLLDLLYRDAIVSLDRKRVLYEEVAAVAVDARRFITANGTTLRAFEWEQRTGIPRNVITRRIDNRGWSPEDAVSVPTSVGGWRARNARRAA